MNKLLIIYIICLSESVHMKQLKHYDYLPVRDKNDDMNIF